MLVFTEESIIESGCIMFITNESIHKLESVTITVYVPSVRLLISWVVSPLLHWYVYGLTPPVTERSIDPVESPWHKIFVLVEKRIISVGSVSSIVSYTVHPLESVTITVYVPASKESISSLIELKLLVDVQLYVYGSVPSTVFMLMAPVLSPKQKISV